MDTLKRKLIFYATSALFLSFFNQLAGITLAFGQTIQYGPKIGYVTDFKMTFNASNVGNATIYSTRDVHFYDGFRVGGFIEKRMEKPFSVIAELGYSETFGGGSSYLLVFGPTSARSALFTHKASDFKLSGKYDMPVLLQQNERRLVRLLGKGVGRMSLHIGLSYWRFGVKNRLPLQLFPEEPDTPEPILIQNEANRIEYGIQESFISNILVIHGGAQVDITKKLFAEFNLERTLTPVSRQLSYRENNYAFRQSSKRITISLGYRFSRKKK